MRESPIESLIFLLQETLKFCQAKGNCTAKQIDFLEGFRVSRLVPIFQRHQRAIQTPFHVCLIGQTNVGKSTLVEALLGVPVAPEGNGPTTSVPVEYSHAARWSLEVHHHSALHLPVFRSFDEPEALAGAIGQYVLYLGDAEAAKIATVVVKGPFKFLGKNLVLADTPGINAAKEGIQEINAPAFMPPFLEKAGRCYLCVAAGVSWEVTPEEEEFYAVVKSLCTNVLVTRWEGSDQEEEGWKAQFAKLFPGAEFEFVNARRAFDVARMRTILEGLSSKEQRLVLVRGEILKAWEDLNRHFDTVFNKSVPWPPAMLQRFRAACRDFTDLQPIISEIAPS